MRLKRQSSSAGTWRCDACGAFNDEPDTICAECSAQRIETASSRPKPFKVEKGERETSDFEIPATKAPYAEEAVPEPSTLLNEPEEEKEEASTASEPEQGEASTEEIDAPTEEAPEPEPEPQPKLEPFKFQTSTPSFTAAPTSSTFTSGQSRFYITFVSSPASSLVKSKVPIDFETFPTITIGRSPENVIVLPDQEVSRKHAELTIDGDKITLTDLGSKNGTFLYDGKKFTQVSDSVEVKPNSVVKFGTGTIVRLTSE